MSKKRPSLFKASLSPNTTTASTEHPLTRNGSRGSSSKRTNYHPASSSNYATSYASMPSDAEMRRQADADAVEAEEIARTNSINSHSNPMHKFYITRLKHSLIISFLFLIPIQNAFLFLILQLSEKVNIIDQVGRDTIGISRLGVLSR